VTTVEYVYGHVMPAALAFLPAPMDSPEARAQMLAIGFQESGFAVRKQSSGPARGFWQFEERGGVNGVLGHPKAKPIIDAILPILVVKPWECYDAIEQNDVLACIFARLLLWTHPQPLPRKDNAPGAYNYYLDLWRPGRPHKEVWSVNFQRAWEIVQPGGGA